MEQRQHTILVVEDEMPLQEAIKAKLETSGFGVIKARTAEQALGYLDDDIKIHAVWLDHYLLGKDDGVSVVEYMKKEGSQLNDVPVFVVSNTASPDKVEKYIQLGVTQYYTKADYRLDEIISDINEFLSSRNGG